MAAAMAKRTGSDQGLHPGGGSGEAEQGDARAPRSRPAPGVVGFGEGTGDGAEQSGDDRVGGPDDVHQAVMPTSARNDAQDVGETVGFGEVGVGRAS